jgi:DNA-binding NtrC family response regulator
MDTVTERRPPAMQPRLLVLNEDATLIHSLSTVLQSSLPKLTLDSSSSPSHAQLLFDTSAYHAVICSPGLNFVDGQSFLTRSHKMHPPMPFLLTLGPNERAHADDWLEFGVYDFIFSPLDPSQALKSVQDALVLSKQRGHIVHKKQVLAHLRQRREQYLTTRSQTPLGQQVGELLRSSITRLEESGEAFEKTVNRIEASLKALQYACQANELHARQRALYRLRTDLASST